MQHTETITIGRPSEDVWAYVGDVRSWPKWLEDVSDVDVQSGEMAEGTQLSYKFRGRETHPTITAYEQGQMLGIAASERGYEFAESIRLHSDGDQTEVSFTMGFEPTVWWMKGLAAALSPFKRTVLGRSMRKEMRSLKTAVEAEATQEA